MHTDVKMWRVNTVSDKLEKDFAPLDSDAYNGSTPDPENPPCQSLFQSLYHEVMFLHLDGVLLHRILPPTSWWGDPASSR